MSYAFISTDTVSKIGKGFPNFYNKEVRSKNYLTCEEMLINDFETEMKMNKIKYRLDKVVDCLRIFNTTVANDKGIDINKRFTQLLNNLQTFENKTLVTEDALLLLQETIVYKRELHLEILRIAESRARYKTMKLSEMNDFISNQFNIGLLLKCKECGRITLKQTEDHIYPKSKNGIDHPFNIQMLCSICNCKKSNIVEKKPTIEVYYHTGCKVLLPVYQAKKLGLGLESPSKKGIVYANNPHILTLPNLT